MKDEILASVYIAVVISLIGIGHDIYTQRMLEPIPRVIASLENPRPAEVKRHCGTKLGFGFTIFGNYGLGIVEDCPEGK